MKDSEFLVRAVGAVHSPLKSLEDCPKQGSEGAPEAWLEVDPDFEEGLEGITVGCELFLLTWLHQAERDTLKVHPRGNPAAPLRGVFSTRSPNRPNPIGLHRVEVLDIDKGGRLRVHPLETLDGTPILDIKPVIKESKER
jgi:tRNA-Thr(GGU) m(6)t(6)A37 methyltransferase TsaA